MFDNKELNQYECLEDSLLYMGSFLKYKDIVDLEKAFNLIDLAAPLSETHIQNELQSIMSKYQELSSLGRHIEEFLYFCAHKLNYCLLHLSLFNR
jgi:hypothetical protein